jgi:O-antigen/teichoic acid export membrane protein
VVLAAFPPASAARGFGWRESLPVAAGILLCAWFQVSSSVRVLALRLMDRYGQSYRAEVAGSGLRLGLTGAMVAAGALWAWLGVLASGLGMALTSFLARPGRPVRVEEDLGPYRRKVLHYLLPSLPSALYFSIQGPLTVWLAATFGGTRNIAEVGALGRLGLMMGIFGSLTGVVFLPRLARIADERLYWRRYVQFGAALAAVAAAVLLAAALAPGLFLMLLGKQYSGLHRELLLTVGSSAFTLVGGYVVGVNLARSWNRWEWLAVVLLIASQAVMVATLPLSRTSGVLAFNLLSGAVGLSLQLAITVTGFFRPRWVQWMP